MPKRKINRRTFLKLTGAAAGVAAGGGLAAHLALDNNLLLGVWRCMVPIPSVIWQNQLEDERDLSFMSADHHRVRDFVVTELPRVAQPLSPEFIAGALRLPVTQMVDILDDLEKRLTFLFRNDQGAVTWAYPVTVERTPHRLTFSSGEQVYAA